MIKFIAFIVTLCILMLVACGPANNSTPTERAEPPTSSALLTVANETVTPTEEPTPTNTATSTPDILIPAPEGIIYRTDAGLWRVEKEGSPYLIYQLIDSSYTSLSPDNTHILYFEYATESQPRGSQYVIDLSTLNKTQIYPRDNLNICLFTWMPGHPNTIHTVLLEEGADPGYSCGRGSPVFTSLDGSNLIVLDKDGSGWSSPSISPNGKYVAFDKGGIPWFYEWGKTAHLFDTNRYGISQSGASYFSAPSWSPDSNKLAWIRLPKTQDQGQDDIDIIIFDIRDKTFTNLYPCQTNNNAPCGLGNYEGSQSHIAWSGDGAYISIINYGFDTFGVYSLDGQYRKMFADGFHEIQWSSSNSWYARTESTESCYKVFVESAGNQESHEVGCGDSLIWSPDGSRLIFGKKGLGWWFVDIKTWSVKQLDMPNDSEITTWTDLSNQ
ncbi:MAG: PD40 domain-containing protein [Chloroflexi bacterium]|nr:PD40 domain-containing protein [Chloroflexota bacterium]